MIPAWLPSSQRPCGSRAIPLLPLEIDMKYYVHWRDPDTGEERFDRAFGGDVQDAAFLGRYLKDTCGAEDVYVDSRR